MQIHWISWFGKEPQGQSSTAILCFISWGRGGPTLPPLYKEAFYWEEEIPEFGIEFENSKGGPFALNFFADQINSE